MPGWCGGSAAHVKAVVFVSTAGDPCAALAGQPDGGVVDAAIQLTAAAVIGEEGSPDATAHDERGGAAIQALIDLRLGAALCEQHLHRAPNVSFIPPGDGTEARQADESFAVCGQESLDLFRHVVVLNRHRVWRAIYVARVSAARVMCSYLVRRARSDGGIERPSALGGLEVDDQFELVLLDGKVAGLAPFCRDVIGLAS